MSDDLTVMGIAATAAAAMGREQIVLAHQAEHPLAGNTDVATDPKPSPDLAVALALPGRCLQVGFDRHQQRLVRDRGLRSPTLCRRLLGVLAGGHGVERGAGHAPGGADPPQAVGQTRAGRGGGTHRRDLRRPKGPKVSVLASSSSTCMVNSPIASWRYSSSACTGSPLRCLSEASIPPIAFSRHCSSRKISTPNWRDRSCTGSSRKSRRTTSRLRATVHRWPSPSAPAGKAWPGENVDEPSSPAFTTGPSTATFFSNYRSCSGPPWTLRLSQFCVQEIGSDSTPEVLEGLRLIMYTAAPMSLPLLAEADIRLQGQTGPVPRPNRRPSADRSDAGGPPECARRHRRWPA